MQTTTGLVIALVTASVIGFGLTSFSVREGESAASRQIGAWHLNPKAGTPEADPYIRAVNARLGALPMALADGIELTAETDSHGASLDGRCRIRLEKAMPNARYWTLTLYDAEWKLVANDTGRSSFTSAEMVREGDGTFAINIAPTPQSGNWLPTGGVSKYRLVLRLYDTLISTAVAGRDSFVPPVIVREGCP